MKKNYSELMVDIVFMGKSLDDPEYDTMSDDEKAVFKDLLDYKNELGKEVNSTRKS